MLPTEIIHVKYRWDEPTKNSSGIPTKTFTSKFDAEEHLREAAREHDIYDVEISIARITQDDWIPYKWVEPSSGYITKITD